MAKCCGTAAEEGGAATGRYYAVRAGYASSVTIRSAIFLHREHAHQFIADRHNITPSGKVEYAGNWVRMQRVAYKKFKAGEQSTMTAAVKALKLAEVGFCFDASDRFKCSKP